MKLNWACFLVIFALGACNSNRTQRGVYYWKTSFALSSVERKFLEENHITKIYLRFFDVDVSKTSKALIPVGKLKFVEKPSSKFHIVPVVYITNKAAKQLEEKDTNDLGLRILKQIQVIAGQGDIRYAEVQMDCDWTETSRNNYFKLLTAIREQLKQEGKKLSVTIRLHQVKYRTITGIPPCDRGMLMFYNMGELSAGSTQNSIYNRSDAQKYVRSLNSYPLPLDVALPVFSWGIQIRNGQIVSLLNNFPKELLNNNSNFELRKNVYVTTKSHFFKGYYFKENDSTRFEEIGPTQCMDAAVLLSKYTGSAKRTVNLFHLDSINMYRYEKETVDSVYNCFK